MRILVALLVSAGGTAMVFGLLLAMNAATERPHADLSAHAVAMDVAPKPRQPPRRPAPDPRPPPAAPRPAVAPPPLPSLGTGLTAVSLGLPATELDLEASAAGLFADVKATVMTEDAVDEKPRPTRRVAAQYPPRARAKNISGFVTMSLLIGEYGTVERIKVLRADPPGVFDQAAQDAIRSWQFEPATYSGEPVKVWANQTIRFELR